MEDYLIMGRKAYESNIVKIIKAPTIEIAKSCFEDLVMKKENVFPVEQIEIHYAEKLTVAVAQGTLAESMSDYKIKRKKVNLDCNLDNLLFTLAFDISTTLSPDEVAEVLTQLNRNHTDGEFKFYISKNFEDTEILYKDELIVNYENKLSLFHLIRHALENSEAAILKLFLADNALLKSFKSNQGRNELEFTELNDFLNLL